MKTNLSKVFYLALLTALIVSPFFSLISFTAADTSVFSCDLEDAAITTHWSSSNWADINSTTYHGGAKSARCRIYTGTGVVCTNIYMQDQYEYSHTNYIANWIVGKVYTLTGWGNIEKFSMPDNYTSALMQFSDGAGVYNNPFIISSSDLSFGIAVHNDTNTLYWTYYKRVSGVTDIQVTATAVSLDAWHSMSATFNYGTNSTVNFYADGSLLGTMTNIPCYAGVQNDDCMHNFMFGSTIPDQTIASNIFWRTLFFDDVTLTYTDAPIPPTPPVLSNDAHSTEVEYESCQFSVTAQDDNGVSGFIFAYKEGSGSWMNLTWTSAGNSTNTVLVKVRTLPIASTGTYYYQWFANDTLGAWVASDVVSFTILETDVTPPTFSDEVGDVYWQTAILYITLTDDRGLEGWIGSSNSSGTWTNTTLFSTSGTTQDVSFNATMLRGSDIVAYRFYAKDNSVLHENWAASDVYFTDPDTTTPYGVIGETIIYSDHTYIPFTLYEERTIDGFYVQTNETGTLSNSTYQHYLGSQDPNLGIALTYNITASAEFDVEIFVNDTSGNWGDSNVVSTSGYSGNILFTFNGNVTTSGDPMTAENFVRNGEFVGGTANWVDTADDIPNGLSIGYYDGTIPYGDCGMVLSGNRALAIIDYGNTAGASASQYYQNPISTSSITDATLYAKGRHSTNHNDTAGSLVFLAYYNDTTSSTHTWTMDWNWTKYDLSPYITAGKYLTEIRLRNFMTYSIVFVDNITMLGVPFTESRSYPNATMMYCGNLIGTTLDLNDTGVITLSNVPAGVTSFSLYAKNRNDFGNDAGNLWFKVNYLDGTSSSSFLHAVPYYYQYTKIDLADHINPNKSIKNITLTSTFTPLSVWTTPVLPEASNFYFMADDIDYYAEPVYFTLDVTSRPVQCHFSLETGGVGEYYLTNQTGLYKPEGTYTFRVLNYSIYNTPQTVYVFDHWVVNGVSYSGYTYTATLDSYTSVEMVYVLLNLTDASAGTWYFRSDTHSPHSELSYKLETEPSHSMSSITATLAGNNTVSWGMRAWAYNAINQTTELTNGAPEAVVFLAGNVSLATAFSGYFSCDEIPFTVDSVKVQIYVKFGDGSWTLKYISITKVGKADSMFYIKLHECTWTVIYYLTRIENATHTQTTFYFGDFATADSRINLDYDRASPWEVSLAETQNRDYARAAFTPWTYWLGDLFWVVLLIGGITFMYLRHGSYKMVLLLLWALGGSGSIIWAIIPAAGLHVATIMLGLAIGITLLRLVHR